MKLCKAVEQNPQSRVVVTRQIDGVDKAIDSAVYELYGLSEGEIAVVG